jgi:uncharacterized membrane protein YdcZ (DUF606 family)
VAGLVAGQLVIAATIDRLGILGLEEKPLRLGHGIGIALLIVGTVLVTSR